VLAAHDEIVVEVEEDEAPRGTSLAEQHWSVELADPLGSCSVAVQVFLDFRIGDEVLLYELGSYLLLYPKPDGETDRGHAVDDFKAYCLSRGALLVT
jgi:hypothetical protein